MASLRAPDPGPLEQAHPTFFALSDPATLDTAWDKVRANAGARGGDGMTIERFSVNAASRLIGLSRHLREGSYRPGPLRRAYIPKKHGGLRPLDIPTVPDRIVQAAAAMVLTPLLEPEFEDSSFAYRPGRGVVDAVARVKRHRRDGFRHVVDADISRYFESVDHEALLTKLDAVVTDALAVDLVGLWLEAYAPEGIGLPQGSPVSPLLANLYLDALDERMAVRGVRLVRYADDFVLLCRTADQAEGALALCERVLAQEGLVLNRDKTRLVSFDKGFRFLGHIFVKSMAFQETALDDTPGEDAVAAAAEVYETLANTGPADIADLSGGEAPDADRLSRRRLIYVLEPGRRLSAEGGSFVVMDGEERLLALGARRVDRIEIGLQASVETEALDLAADNAVAITRIDGHGRTLGRYLAPNAGHAARQLAQARHALDPDLRLALARILAAGKVRNQRVLLKRANRAGRDADVAAAATRMWRLHRRIAGQKTVARIMGLEGAAAAEYWPAFARLLPDGWTLPARRRRPASSPVDTALNVLSGFLARDCEAALLRSGLHIGIGFLHETSDTADALIYDLMEEFRAPVVEGALLAALGRGAIAEDMFAFQGKGGWRLHREGYGALVRTYETQMARLIRDHVDDERTSWRTLIQRQARRLAAHVEDTQTYQPYPMDY